MPNNPLATPRPTPAGIDGAHAADAEELRRIERNYGWLSDDPVLVEDGRATRLAHLPDGGTLYLTRAGALLVLRPSPPSGTGLHVEIHLGTPRQMWASLASRCSGVGPGEGVVGRYRVLREVLSPGSATYAVFDLLTMMVVVRGCDQAKISALASLAERGRLAAVRTGRGDFQA